MTKARTLALALLIGSFTLACDDDDPAAPTQPDVSAFAGAWTSSQIQYTSKADTNRRFNLHDLPGYPGMTMQITPTAGSTTDATFTGVLPFPVGATIQPIPLAGSIQVQSATKAAVNFTWQPPLDQDPPITNFIADFTLQGNSLVFTRPSAEFTFPGTATPEETVLVIAMTRSAS